MMRHGLSILLVLVFGVVFSENLHAEGVWTSYININQVKDIGVHGNTIWALTDGGVVEWDIPTGTHRRHPEFGTYCHVLAVDPEGAVWVGSTIDGLMKYNGSIIKRFTNEDGLETFGMKSIVFGEKGSVLVGTDYIGLYFYDGIVWVELLPRTDVYASASYSAIAPDNSIWAGMSNKALYHTWKGKWVHCDVPSTLYVNRFTALAIDSTGCVWIGTNGAIKFNGLKWERISSDTVTDIAVGADSTVWIGTNSGLLVYKNGKKSTITVENGLPDNQINAITVGLDGTVWFGTEKGIAGFKDGRWTILTDDCQIPLNYVLNMAVDKNGIIWYHTNMVPSPVYAFDGKSWIPYSEENTGIRIEFCQNIESDSKGNIWFDILPMKGNDHLAKFDGKNWANIPLERQNEVQSCDYDSKGRLWVAEQNLSGDGGVGYYDGDVYKRYSKTDGYPSYDAVDLIIDSDDNVWVRTRSDGICQFEGSVWKNYKTNNGLGGNDILSLDVSVDGIVWAGADNGTVSRYDGKSWVYWQLTGIYNYDNNYYQPITSVAVAHNGEVWAASRSGVYRFKDDQWTHYTIVDGLSSDEVNKVVASPTGEVWFATDCGLTKYTPETNTFAEESAPGGYPLITGNYPNPFNMNTTIDFTTVSDNPVTLSVYSLTGQLVRTLMNYRLEPGNHAVPWDGRDDHGQPVSSGVYIARLTAEGTQTAHRMLLLK